MRSSKFNYETCLQDWINYHCSSHGQGWVGGSFSPPANKDYSTALISHIRARWWADQNKSTRERPVQKHVPVYQGKFLV
ncbi:hypothetical protein RRG08_002514 [Elysia crispata]|uniref:Uncharacterized protein n=1 Tax=Elysia crispata TaxID=231223 RepID=A0AAE1A7U7_9GAST|nr:hypothetical protein RRG08_002514 [Elysia crispata]